MTRHAALIGLYRRIVGLKGKKRYLIGCGYRAVGFDDLNPSEKPKVRSELLTACYV
jgi:hypothetical protein